MENHRRAILVAAAALPVAGCAALAPRESLADSKSQVAAAETSFAESMARRDLAAFSALIADDAVFINGGQPLRGKAAIVEHWKRFFVEPAAPFSWRPEITEVGAEGNLGYTEGPVTSPAGAVFAKFFSTWQRRADGRWLVVFDNGYTVCKA